LHDYTGHRHKGMLAVSWPGAGTPSCPMIETLQGNLARQPSDRQDLDIVGVEIDGIFRGPVQTPGPRATGLTPGRQPGTDDRRAGPVPAGLGRLLQLQSVARVANR
jgi:hypothetical protein